MKKTVRRAALLALLLGLLWVLSACGMDNSVEDLFTLPRIPDEYTGLNQQIEDLRRPAPKGACSGGGGGGRRHVAPADRLCVL